MTSFLKALLHYVFLACVFEENARDFACVKSSIIFLSDMMMEYRENIFIISKYDPKLVKFCNSVQSVI